MMKFDYTLLETARLLRQKTQKEVVSEVGVSQASLSKAERGLQELSLDTMSRLSDYYDFPLSFFELKNETLPIGRLYFRKKMTISNKVIDSFLAKVKIYRQIVDDIMSAVELPEYVLTNMIPSDNQSPKEIADRIRCELKIPHGPVPNLVTLLENHGIIIIKFDFGTEKIDGLTSITDADRKIIFLNKYMPNDRIRFSLAHELGHLIMHLGNYPAPTDEAERQADEFASEFLMPEMEIKPMLENLVVQDLTMLKRRWRVSMHALVRRAKDLDVIDYQRYRNFQIFFSKKGFTKNEPVPLPLESPTLWVETLKLYKDELGYSDKDLMSIMHLNRKDYNGWFNTQSNVINIGSMISLV